MPRVTTSSARRVMRHRRVRKKVRGTGERPRLAVFRSLNHIYAQLIDDDRGITLAAVSSLEKHVREQRDGKSKTDVATVVGSLIARRGSESGVKAVVFDRGGYRYHGRVKSLAEAARKGGLAF